MTDLYDVPEAKEQPEKTTLRCNRCGWESEPEFWTSDHPCPESDCGDGLPSATERRTQTHDTMQ